MRTIVESASNNLAVIDVFSKLVQNRIIFIDTEIDDCLANDIIAQLLYLDSVNNEPISIYINSLGGSVYDGFGIIDVMNKINSPTRTICIGKAMSMAALILINGKKRLCTKNSTIMFHELYSTAFGKFKDLETNFKECERLQNIINHMIIEKTSISDFSEIKSSDYFIDAETALKLKVIDEIL